MHHITLQTFVFFLLPIAVMFPFFSKKIALGLFFSLFFFFPSASKASAEKQQLTQERQEEKYYYFVLRNNPPEKIILPLKSFASIQDICVSPGKAYIAYKEKGNIVLKQYEKNNYTKTLRIFTFPTFVETTFFLFKQELMVLHKSKVDHSWRGTMFVIPKNKVENMHPELVTIFKQNLKESDREVPEIGKIGGKKSFKPFHETFKEFHGVIVSGNGLRFVAFSYGHCGVYWGDTASPFIYELLFDENSVPRKYASTLSHDGNFLAYHSSGQVTLLQHEKETKTWKRFDSFSSGIYIQKIRFLAKKKKLVLYGIKKENRNILYELSYALDSKQLTSYCIGDKNILAIAPEGDLLLCSKAHHTFKVYQYKKERATQLWFSLQATHLTASFSALGKYGLFSWPRKNRELPDQQAIYDYSQDASDNLLRGCPHETKLMEVIPGPIEEVYILVIKEKEQKEEEIEGTYAVVLWDIKEKQECSPRYVFKQVYPSGISLGHTPYVFFLVGEEAWKGKWKSEHFRYSYAVHIAIRSREQHWFFDFSKKIVDFLPPSWILIWLQTKYVL